MMESKPQFICLIICDFIIARQISNVCAQTLNCYTMEGSSLTSMASSESTFQSVIPENETETIKILITGLLTELALADKENPNIEIKTNDTLTETDWQEIKELIKIVLEELVDSDKNMTTNETKSEWLIEITQKTLVHNYQDHLDRESVV